MRESGWGEGEEGGAGGEGSGPLLERSNLLQSKFIENRLRTPKQNYLSDPLPTTKKYILIRAPYKYMYMY